MTARLLPTVVDAQSSAGFEVTQGNFTRGKSAEGFKLRRMDAWLGSFSGACGVAGSASGAVVSCAGGLAPVFTEGVQRSQLHAQNGPGAVGAAMSTRQSKEGSHQRAKMGQSSPVPSVVGQGPSGSGDKRSLRVVWALVGAGRRAVADGAGGRHCADTGFPGAVGELIPSRGEELVRPQLGCESTKLCRCERGERWPGWTGRAREHRCGRPRPRAAQPGHGVNRAKQANWSVLGRTGSRGAHRESGFVIVLRKRGLRRNLNLCNIEG